MKLATYRSYGKERIAVVHGSDNSLFDLSASARRIYDVGRPRLLQVRTLLRDQDSQASVGSGSLVGPDGLILTNYHVISQVDRYWEPGATERLARVVEAVGPLVPTGR